MRRAVLLLVAAGCRQVFGLEAPDHVAIDAPSPDVPTDAPRVCIQQWLTGPTFTAPTLVSEVSTAVYESDPSLTADGLRLYFQRGSDIYSVARATTTAAWELVVLESSLSSGSGEAKITLSDDPLHGFLASARPNGAGGMDLWRVERAVGASGWTVDQMFLALVNTAADDHDPHVSRDQLRLYFAPSAANVQKLVVASRPTTADAFSAPVAIGELDGAGAEADPTLTSDERVIVFTSTASGVRRLSYATRTNLATAFGQVTELTALNTGVAQGDSDPYITGDGCTLYFASSRTGAGDIYMTTVQ